VQCTFYPISAPTLLYQRTGLLLRNSAEDLVIPPPPNATTCPFVEFVVLPPGHGRSVTDFWGWDAHDAQLRCPTDVWVVIEEDVVPGGALNLNSTNLPRSWSPWESSPSRKLPTVEPGIETRTSWLVVRNSHQILTVYFHITPLVIS
jgi:hypothetical protein